MPRALFLTPLSILAPKRLGVEKFLGLREFGRWLLVFESQVF
jgi:hypothetical protein